MGYAKRDVPCERCGWKYEGFHICFDASKPCLGEGKVDPNEAGQEKGHRSGQQSAAANARWAQHREENESRDAKILKMYTSGRGLRDVAKEFNVAYQTIMVVIRREEKRTNRKIMRPPGLNNRYIQ